MDLFCCVRVTAAVQLKPWSATVMPCARGTTYKPNVKTLDIMRIQGDFWKQLRKNIDILL